MSLYPADEVKTSCGEETNIVCSATNTNAITIAALNDSYELGKHTYERSSHRLAKAGTLNLYLKETLFDENEFLTNFTVTASEQYMGKVTIVNCMDALHVTRYVKIRAQSKQLLHINQDNFTGLFKIQMTTAR